MDWATAQDIWDHDAKKRRLAESHGFKVVYVWESDYRKDPENEIKRLVKEIQSHL